MSAQRIILLIDESGSMHSQKMSVIDGINVMINSQRKLQKKDINFDIFKFNTTVTHSVSTKLSSIPCFTSQNYSPNGGTALYDAVGYAIHKYRSEPNTTMVICTDGMENSSREYSHKDMLSLIEEQKKSQDWNFVYLCEDPTTMNQGLRMGFDGTRGSSCVCIGRQQTGQNLSSRSFNTYIGEVSQGYTKSCYQDWQKIQKSDLKN